MAEGLFGFRPEARALGRNRNRPLFKEWVVQRTAMSNSVRDVIPTPHFILAGSKQSLTRCLPRGMGTVLKM